MLKDMLGRVIQVGDIIGWSGAGSGIDLSVATKLLPKTIRVGSGGSISPSFCVVLNEQMEASGKIDQMEKLRAEYKEYFDYDTPRTTTSTKYSYVFMFVGDPVTKEVFMRAEKLQANTKDEATSNYYKAVKAIEDAGFVLHYNKSAYDNQYIVSTGRFGSNSKTYVVNNTYTHYHHMLLRDLKALKLEPYVGVNLPFDTFKDLVKDVLTLNTFNLKKLFG